jgi:hypothetical protein
VESVKSVADFSFFHSSLGRLRGRLGLRAGFLSGVKNKALATDLRGFTRIARRNGFFNSLVLFYPWESVKSVANVSFFHKSTWNSVWGLC